MIFEAVPYGAALLFIHGAAYCLELPGINSYGATQEEASENFKEENGIIPKLEQLR